MKQQTTTVAGNVFWKGGKGSKYKIYSFVSTKNYQVSWRLAIFGIYYQNNAFFRHISAEILPKNLQSLFINTSLYLNAAF